MTAETIHTCSYYCERPECVRRQRDELAARMAVTVTPEEIAAMVRKGVEAERERCARVCESLGGNGPGYIDDDWARMCADAIRDGRAQRDEAQQLAAPSAHVGAHDELRVQAALLRTPEFMAQFDPEKFARQLERIATALAAQQQGGAA